MNALKPIVYACLFCAVPKLLSMWFAPDRVYVFVPETPRDIAQLEEAKLVNEAYPQWWRNHPDLTCPSSIFDLLPYMDTMKTDLDPWGVPFTMTCDGKSIVVQSRGPDRQRGTADDLWSRD